MPIVLVTGATGFVGQALIAALAPTHRVRRALRTPAPPQPGCEDLMTGPLGRTTDWSAALAGVDAVVHLAARTHVLHDPAPDPLAAYHAVNVDGTRQLAEQAAAVGVRRFVFLSSIKVNGEATSERPFTEGDDPRPEDAYGVTKLGAERALAEAAAGSGMETVVLRPPLVYGAGVKGNLLALMHTIARGVPLPLGGIHNRRSLIGLDNLVSALVLALTHSAAAGQTFLLADGEDLSTTQLIQLIAAGLGRPARLFPVPSALLALAGSLTGRRATISRLIGSLQVDAGAIRARLGWRPPLLAAEGLARMGRWYHREVLHS
jgi:nucleoside-diphosphate-sugar epimerase